jgi:thioredoxin-like negative regulator of GroEL
MKKVIKIALVVLVLFVVGWFGYKTVRKIRQQKQAVLNTATIPQFVFQTLSHQNFNKQSIADTLGNVVFMLFSPDCEHCQYMAQSMVAHAEQIKNTQFIMVTPFADSAAVAQFAQTYRLNTLPNVQLLLDRNDNFPKIFGASITPSFFIYKNNKLVKSIKGESKIDNLIE